MKRKLSGRTRLLMLLAAAALVVVLFLPIWSIDLDAPQYPEGLKLEIHAKGLQGNVDIINGLNHYIGMKTLHNEDFIEFTLLPFCVLFFTALFVAVAIINRRALLNIVFTLFILFGILAMYDFWRWEYNYGHNLNPEAAIIVPGMAYQPPLIGFKQLLNFGAYSYPDVGGWVFIAAGAVVLFCVVLEGRRAKKKYKPQFVPVILLVPYFLISCNTGPEAIQVGKDKCSFCKMSIGDARFGAELVSSKGKVYKFDDSHCLVKFIQSDEMKNQKDPAIYFVDFSGRHSLIPATKAWLLQSEALRSPMNGNVAAFDNNDSLLAASQKFPGIVVHLDELKRQ